MASRPIQLTAKFQDGQTVAFSGSVMDAGSYLVGDEIAFIDQIVVITKRRWIVQYGTSANTELIIWVTPV